MNSELYLILINIIREEGAGAHNNVMSLNLLIL